MMEYQVGSIAELVSGMTTPNRQRVSCRPLTPRKHRREEPVTPQSTTDSPLGRPRAPPKMALDSPKSTPGLRRRDSPAHPLTRITHQPHTEGRGKFKPNNSEKFNRDYLGDSGLSSHQGYIQKNNKNFQKHPNTIHGSNSETKTSKKISSKKTLPEDIANTVHLESPNIEKISKKKKKTSLSENNFVNLKHSNSLDVDKIPRKNKKSKIYTSEDVNKLANSDSLENIPRKKKKSKKSESNSLPVENESNVEKISKKKKMTQNTSEDDKLLTKNDNDLTYSKRSEDITKKKKKSSKRSLPDGHRSNTENESNPEHLDSPSLENVPKKKKKISKSIDAHDEYDPGSEIEKGKTSQKTCISEDGPSEDQELESDDQDLETEQTEFQKAAQRRLDLKAQRDKKFEPDELNRTVFIGNVPVSVLKGNYKKTLIDKFSKYGEVESVRVRNIPVDDPKTRPKVALIEKKFHPNRSTVSAYVKFKHEESIIKALVENNTLLEGNHIRVDSCGGDKPRTDSRKTLFLGNLPFSVEEETVRDMFSKCGNIASVRIVRDRKTQIGKGFGFVNFEKPDGVELALNMNEDDLKINNKVIRIKRYNAQHSGSSNFADGGTGNFNSGGGGNASRSYGTGKQNGKKRDVHGNKIRKRDQEGFKKKIVSREPSEKSKESIDKGKDSSKFSSSNSSNFSGMIAKKKKKIKTDKQALKKKKISKILMNGK